jgi:hypothetical protein
LSLAHRTFLTLALFATFTRGTIATTWTSFPSFCALRTGCSVIDALTRFLAWFDNRGYG